MVTVFAVSLAGCVFASGNVHQTAVNAAKSYGIEEVDSRTELIRATAKLSQEGSAYLVAQDSEEATSFIRRISTQTENCPTLTLKTA